MPSTWIYPFFEGRLLADIHIPAMKEPVEHLGKLAPSTIRDYTNIVKAIVASAINGKGEELFPRMWNEELIDAPIVKHQNQPSTDRKGMEAILAAAEGAVSSALRASRGMRPSSRRRSSWLEIGKHISVQLSDWDLSRRSGQLTPRNCSSAFHRLGFD
jgi:hypothetical protein